MAAMCNCTITKNRHLQTILRVFPALQCRPSEGRRMLPGEDLRPKFAIFRDTTLTNRLLTDNHRTELASKVGGIQHKRTLVETHKPFINGKGVILPNLLPEKFGVVSHGRIGFPPPDRIIDVSSSYEKEICIRRFGHLNTLQHGCRLFHRHPLENDRNYFGM